MAVPTHHTGATDGVPISVSTGEDVLQAQLDQLEGQFLSLREQLRHAQRLASVGTMSAMLAHEFNNLFTPIMAYARQALDTGDEGLTKKALEKTLSNVEIMRQMCDRIVGMVKNGETGHSRYRIVKLIEDAMGCLGRDLAKDNIAVKIQIDPELAVRVNGHQIQQVLFNLILNARQAMLGRHGRLTLDAEPTGDGKVAVHVRDSGCGIRDEDLVRVFEPFFSTKQYEDKPDKRGLGLGLAICRELVEEHDGELSVESELGKGTTFTLTLPAAD
ncbi:MAG: sensor histidine kinase [Phycisphaerae bacterium]|nr:sensor histidine kinase [Phycisphaerae bacterium]